MKTIILAAGYGTRLYPLTLNTPKALLSVGGKTILDRVVEEVMGIDQCDAVAIVSNNKFYKSFCEWRETAGNNTAYASKEITVLNDGTTSNEMRLGAIGDISFAVERLSIDDDVLVVGSDNLFGFRLVDFAAFADGKRPAACLALHDIGDIKKASLYGIATIDPRTNAILDFQEKPREPKSTLAATAVYFYPREKVPFLKAYMADSGPKDAPGNFIKWLSRREKVYGFRFTEKWYDIGDIASLEQADREFRER